MNKKPETITVKGEQFKATVLVRVGSDDAGRPLFRAMAEDESIAVHEGQVFVVGYMGKGGRKSLFDRGQ